MVVYSKHGESTGIKILVEDGRIVLLVRAQHYIDRIELSPQESYEFVDGANEAGRALPRRQYTDKEIDEMSHKNAEFLRGVFGLPDATPERSEEEIFKSMEGCLAKYSEPSDDSAELVRSVRDRNYDND